MPIELIKQIQKQRAEEAARQEAARQEVSRKEALVREEAERQKKEAAEKRRQFVITQTEKIFGESRALEGLKRIDKEMLEGNTSKHSLNYSPENRTATLAWGNGFKQYADGSVQAEGYDYNFSYICIKADPDKETLIIEGQAVFQSDKNGWKDLNRVERVLALAYVDPVRKVHSPPSSSYSSSDRGGDMGCCCCSGN